MKSRACAGCALALLVFLLAACRTSRVPATGQEEAICWPQPPAPSDLRGNWFGMTADDVYYYGLSLREDGTGSLAYTFASNPPSVLKVTRWHLEGRDIALKVDSTRSMLKPLSIRGTAGKVVIYLAIQGSSWKQDVRFRRMDGFDRKYELLKATLINSPEISK